MGYNGHIYKKEEYVDVISSDEVERLLGYGVITVSPLAVAVKADPEPIKEEEVVDIAKTPDTSVIKEKRRTKKK